MASTNIRPICATVRSTTMTRGTRCALCHGPIRRKLWNGITYQQIPQAIHSRGFGTMSSNHSAVFSNAFSNLSITTAPSSLFSSSFPSASLSSTSSSSAVPRSRIYVPKQTPYHQSSKGDTRQPLDPDEPIYIAIVGSGPSAFYTAKYLLASSSPIAHRVRISIVEALPAPFGLVRYGVAPDHPEVKNVSKEFTATLEHPQIEYYGNLEIGKSLSWEQLRPFFHAIVFAYGANTHKKLMIPQSQLHNIFSARSFVNWYNSHPYFRHFAPNLQVKSAVIIGQGNVAIDCARMLLMPTSLLASTDVNEGAMRSLKQSTITDVYLLGRRGPTQSAFTTAEYREISSLPNVNVIFRDEDWKEGMTEASVKECDQRPIKRKVDLLQTTWKNQSPPTEINGVNVEDIPKKNLHIHYLSAPHSYIENPNQKGCVGAIRIERTKLIGEPGGQVAVGSGIFEEIPCGLVFESIGYASSILKNLPFDPKNAIIPTKEGRVGKSEVGLYASGWVKRGPKGIIGTNIGDAKETVQSIISDVLDGTLTGPILSHDKWLAFIRSLKHQIVDKHGWKRIDDEEIRRGELHNKIRSKIGSVEEMLQIANGPLHATEAKLTNAIQS